MTHQIFLEVEPSKHDDSSTDKIFGDPPKKLDIGDKITVKYVGTTKRCQEGLPDLISLLFEIPIGSGAGVAANWIYNWIKTESPVAGRGTARVQRRHTISASSRSIEDLVSKLD